MARGKRKWSRLGNDSVEQVLFKVVDWCYRGEGNANLVLSLPKTQQILRIRKTDVPKTFLERIFSWILQLFAWNDGSQMENEARDVEFYTYVMTPLIGGQFVKPAVSVNISRGDIQRLNKELAGVRPRHRQKKQLQNGRATLFVDYAYLPNAWNVYHTFAGSVYAVEIKPKQGWVSSEDKQYAKCPFCLNQYLKLKNQQTSCISNYCPLDLFSGDKTRMYKAIKSLLNSPQNNLKIFKDGMYIYGEGFSTDSLNNIFFEWFANQNILGSIEEFCYIIQQTLTNKFPNEHPCNKDIHTTRQSTNEQEKYNINEALKATLEKCTKKCNFSGPTLPKFCVLDRILNFQKLDNSGVNQVYPTYNVWKKETKNKNVDNYTYVDTLLKCLGTGADRCILCTFQFLQQDHDDLEMLLAPYLMAAVIRDCSIMMCFQRIVDTSEAQYGNDVTIVRSENGLEFAVNIGIFDLYPKPIKAIEKHKRRNWEIHAACLEQLVS